VPATSQTFWKESDWAHFEGDAITSLCARVRGLLSFFADCFWSCCRRLPWIARQREVTRCTPIRNSKPQFRHTRRTFHSPSKSADAATRCFYAVVARRAATRARSPASTERTAWISARHPMTFRGRWQRSPCRHDRACLIDLRLLPIWRWICESIHCVAFCSVDICLTISLLDAYNDRSCGRGVATKNASLREVRCRVESESRTPNKPNRNVREVAPDRRISLET